MISKHWPIQLIGAACSIGGKHVGCRYGPDVLQRHFTHSKSNLPSWKAIIREPQSHLIHSSVIEAIQTFSRRLSDTVLATCKTRHMPLVLGGDHSCALGTWAGISHTRSGPFGMLWIDAHLDSHTPQSSLSGAIHGMPLASLLGHGDQNFLQLGSRSPVLDPDFTVVIGARSFETDEYQLLNHLGVEIITMDDILRNGLEKEMITAVRKVAQCRNGYGISIDLDAFDPGSVPGVSVPEPGGISVQHFLYILNAITRHHNLLGLEIAEFNPGFDATGRTANLIQNIIEQLCEADQFKVAS